MTKTFQGFNLTFTVSDTEEIFVFDGLTELKKTKIEDADFKYIASSASEYSNSKLDLAVLGSSKTNFKAYNLNNSKFNDLTKGAWNNFNLPGIDSTNSSCTNFYLYLN